MTSVPDNRGVHDKTKNSVDFSTREERGPSGHSVSKDRIISRLSLWQLSQQVMAINVISVEIFYRLPPPTPPTVIEKRNILCPSGKVLGKRIDFLVGCVFPLIFSVSPRSPVFFFFFFFSSCSCLLFSHTSHFRCLPVKPGNPSCQSSTCLFIAIISFLSVPLLKKVFKGGLNGNE